MKLHHLLIITGLFVTSAVSLQASVDSVMKLELLGYMQKKSSTSETTERGSVDRFRVESKQLLSLIAKQSATKFPSGSKLQVTTDGTVYVADSKGKWVTDVSEYLEVAFDDKNRLFDGKRNVVTGTESSKNYFPVSLAIRLPGLTGTVSGIAIENFKVRDPDGDGVRIITGDSKSTVNGKGTVEEGPALYDGRLRLIGRRAEIIR